MPLPKSNTYTIEDIYALPEEKKELSSLTDRFTT